jgi:hypothetical protein
VWPHGAAAQTTAVVARAASVSGQPLLSSGNGAPPLALTTGYILNPGDRIDTRGGARVVIDLSDGSMVVVQPESVIVLKDFRSASSLRELFAITLGFVRVKINHFAGRPNPYRMNSPTASIAVRGTEFSIEVGAQGDTQVVVYEGVVEVTSLADPDRKVLIEAGRGVLVQAGQDFHVFAGSANRDVADRNDASDRDRHTPPSAGVGAMAARGAASQTPSASPAPPAPAPPPSRGDREETSPRATASTYDRYIAGLSDIAQTPFLFRFNAFPEAHLDSLENPAYATGFQAGEGRVFFLPTFSGARGLQEYQAAFGPGGTLPGDYSVSPQFSMFTPIAGTGFVLGGSVSASRVGNTALSATPDSDPAALSQANSGLLHTSGSSTSNFYSGALVGARQFGRNSFGLELESLKGTGSLTSATIDTDVAGRPSVERIDSTSDVSQTRLTAGFSRDVSKDAKLGIFYRYAFITANDGDRSHTIDGVPMGLNSTRTTGHSSELGLRLRGSIAPRLFYGVAGAWLGVSLADGLARTNAVDSHERDRSQRGSLAIGLGYALTRRTVVSFDLAGGTARTWAARTEDATGNVLQNGVANSHFVSLHAAVQMDLSRHLFVSASLLNVWQSHDLNVVLFPDQYGNRTLVEDSYFQLTPAAYRLGSRFSDFGAGWRFSRNLFAQYVYSTDYGATSATHTLMLRYTFHFGRE